MGGERFGMGLMMRWKLIPMSVDAYIDVLD